MDKPLNEEFKKKLLTYYREAGKTTIEFDIETLLEDITEQEYFTLLQLTKRYDNKINAKFRENL